MAVDSIKTEAEEEITSSVLRDETRKKPIVTKQTKGKADKTATGSSQNTQDIAKKERLAREAEELLKYLYSAMDKTRLRKRKCLVYSRDEDSASENDDSFDYDDDYLDCDTYKLVGRKQMNYRRSKRDRTLSKEQKFASFCRENETPENITLEKGKKKALRVKYNSCVKQMSRNANRRDHNERRKANIEKKFEKLGIKRRERITVERTDAGTNPNAEKFAVREENVPEEMRNMVDFLMALQDREVTPEDYEFLLKLDELIPKKTVSEECLDRLKEDVVDGSHVEDLCGICMENYEVGQVRKILPCEHVFHSNCIDQWLSQSSTKCPLDGLEL